MEWLECERFSLVKKLRSDESFLNALQAIGKTACNSIIFASRLQIVPSVQKPFTSEIEMERNIKTNVWNIWNSTTHFRTIEALREKKRKKRGRALNHIRLVFTFICVDEREKLNKATAFISILNGICIEKNVRCSFVGYCCFSEELIKIKSSIQMIKVEMDGATSRVWDTEQQMSSEWHFRLAFFNLWTIFIIHAHDHKIFIYLLSIN